MNLYLAEARRAVIAKPAMVLAKITKREAVQVPAMRGVAERAEVGVMRRRDKKPAAGLQHPMKFLHGPDDVGHVLDDVDSAQLAERAVAKRVWKTIQVAKHVGAGIRVAIHANGSRVFVNSAADVENPSGS